jgi:membrane protease YdiL (CAAX protease family)
MTDGGESPFWKYEDLAMFVGAILPAWLVGLLLVRMSHTKDEATRTLIFQASFFLLLLGVLYGLISVRYGKPFWRSLGWVVPARGAWWCVAAAPVLAVGTTVLGVLLHEPQVGAPIQDLISNRTSLIIVMLFVTVLGPVYEELFFRGFLYPLLARSFGAAAGIALTAAPFALLHGAQYQWAWQQIALVGVAGLVFGFARYRTRSTAAAAILHCGYNTTLFVGFLAQQWL